MRISISIVGIIESVVLLVWAPKPTDALSLLGFFGNPVVVLSLILLICSCSALVNKKSGLKTLVRLHVAFAILFAVGVLILLFAFEGHPYEILLFWCLVFFAQSTIITILVLLRQRRSRTLRQEQE